MAKRKSRAGSGTALAGACILLASVTVCVLAAVFAGSGGVRPSTSERSPLEPLKPFDPDCVDDRAGWIAEPDILSAGMSYFYDLTGVQPALCVANDIDGEWPDDEAVIEQFATEEYDALIGHERGVLLLFFEWGPLQWDAYYLSGADAQSVMDAEACHIMTDLVGEYYESDMPEDEYFSAVFSETADRIMVRSDGLSREAGISVAVLGAAWAVLLGAILVKRRRKL